MEDRAAEGRAASVLEGQVFLRYSRHNVNVPATGAWARLGPLLQTHSRLTPPHLLLDLF